MGDLPETRNTEHGTRNRKISGNGTASLRVMREYTAHLLGLACNATNDADWASLLPVLQRDLRGQVFFR